MSSLARNLGLGYLALCLLLLVSMLAGGPRFYAPAALVAPPAAEPVTITFAYSSEKEAWLEAAIAAFEQSGTALDDRPIKVEQRQLSSGQLSEEIRAGRLTPTGISPASMLDLKLFDQAWQTEHGGGTILAPDDLGPRSLVSSPLVLVAWKAQGDAHWPAGTFTWNDLSRAVDPNVPDDQYLRISHTRPTKSSSGLMALVLMAYHFYQQQDLSAADIQGALFQQWLTTFEHNLTWYNDAGFDSSSGLIQNMVTRGPAQYHGVITYENLALEHAQNPRASGGELQLYYPTANLWADHPFAILSAPWVTPEQKQAARLLRDYLLGVEAQRKALLSGFRPANAQVSIDDPDPANPFLKTSFGVRSSISQLVKEPPLDVVEALRETWSRAVNR